MDTKVSMLEKLLARAEEDTDFRGVLPASAELSDAQLQQATGGYFAVTSTHQNGCRKPDLSVALSIERTDLC